MLALRQPAPLVQADVLYRSTRTSVHRLNAEPGKTVIRKTLLGGDALARLHRESRALTRLAPVAGVPKLLSCGDGPSLILSDCGGASLAQSGRLRNIPIGTLVSQAVELARTLGAVHRCGVLHLDISPANIVIPEDGATPQLIDFDLSVFQPDEHRNLADGSGIFGTLEYMAPELTGRSAQGVDERTDLYALGATLYELATGTPPFGQGDTLQLVRDHAATRPVPPSERRPALPSALSDIVMRLLEKAPDLRYQSADGLADDLEHLRRFLIGRPGSTADLALGRTDFSSRLAAPSRLFGREAAETALLDAFTSCLTDDCRGLLVTGASGVGKTTLIGQLRSPVSRHGGWVIADDVAPASSGSVACPIVQALRGVVLRLLAEPEAELDAVRARLEARLGEGGSRALLAILPEAADLIGGAPECVTGARAHAACLAFLHAVATPLRPIVVVVDDAHMASPGTLRLAGDVLAAAPLPGLLLILACRSEALDAGTPLAACLAKWDRAGIAPRRLELEDLPHEAVSAMLAEILRMPSEQAAMLAATMCVRTGGNPFHTLELLNSLWRHGALRRDAGGWSWDPADIRRHVGQDDVGDMLLARLAKLPKATGDLLAELACLDDGLPPCAPTGPALDHLLSPALEDGLLVRHGEHALRFRHARVRQIVYDAQPAASRRKRHLALARRLAPLPGQGTRAADQYLLADDPVLESGEASRAATLFAEAAAQATANFRPDAVERYLGAAIRLGEARAAPDVAQLNRLRTARISALYGQGRYEEVDRLFCIVSGQAGGDELLAAEAACVQVLSLTNQGRHTQAVATGLDMLGRLGLHRPSQDLSGEVSRGLAELAAWLRDDAAHAIARPTQDQTVRIIARLIWRILPTAQLLDPITGAWLSIESQRLWARHGACPEMIAGLARSAAAANVFADHRLGYDMARHAVAVGQSSGLQPETSLARQNLATFALHWFERLEHTLEQVGLAAKGLTEAGEVQAACINHISSLAALFDCAPTLDAYGAELATAREFTVRTGHDQLFESFASHQVLLDGLTGKLEAAPRLAAAAPDAIATKPLARFGHHCSHALLALLLGEDAALARHSAAAIPLLSRIGGAYRSSTARLLRALSLASALRGGADPAAKSGQDAAELADLVDWFAARATDSAANFEHLWRFVTAESAWAAGDTSAAARAFDHALQCCAGQCRPWHQAIIAEHAGLFHLAHGMDYAGRLLLHDAHDRYAAWGASAVTKRLAATHGFLDGEADGAVRERRGPPSLRSDTVDLLAIIRASQALSSQTTVAGLHAHVTATLAAMTGASSCRLVVHDLDGDGWHVPLLDDTAAESLETAAAHGALPLSVFRYVERTRKPLLIDNVILDDRFARDPYFDGLTRCSLMVLPVDCGGERRAMLMVENRLNSGAFSLSRLDLVCLVASQLAVSLNNAQIYASLERRVAQRTAELATANRRLEALSTSDGLTGLANRRRLDTVLAAEWARGLLEGTSFGLVLVDIDHFKQFNDRYGHVRGDDCLRKVAGALLSTIRGDIDVSARYGGEEFALVLPGADLPYATDVAARACAAVAALGEPHADSRAGMVTVSLGVAACVPRTGDDVEHLIASADVALYEAKRHGRNCVRLAGQSC